MTPATPVLEVDHSGKNRTLIVGLVISALLAGLPLAIWLDLRNLSDEALRMQADELGGVIDAVRGIYTQDIVARLQDKPDSKVTVVHNYREIPGAIPNPATLSIELAEQISQDNVGTMKYRFVSDFPFKNRGTPHLDPFEKKALETMRTTGTSKVEELSGSIFNRHIRVATPVIMTQSCIDCHNSHPLSPKRDWKAGDVRGIQTVAVELPVFKNIFAFTYLLSFMLLAVIVGVAFIYLQKRQAAIIGSMNGELAKSNSFLATISGKLAKYLSPQVYKSIFSGEKDVVISTERKKLTIFFSDIKDFTETTERLQPEEITALLNEYFTEMSAIALKHGATIDKFIGDAILIFFGDPQTKGVKEDARACLHMALEMQVRLLQMNADWRSRGVENPFRVRMGINTGYCNVGNFGSNERMDYTIIGAEANLAARLQTSAEPGRIVMSYETYALVNDMVRAHPLPPIKMKGIAHEVVPYAIEGLQEESGKPPAAICELGSGLSLVVNLDAMDDAAIRHARERLQAALHTLDKRRGEHEAS